MKALIYLLQVSACTGIFYSFYFLFLRKLTFFTLNRWYLLVTLLVSFVIPALSFTLNTLPSSAIMQPAVYIQQLQTFAKAPVITISPALREPQFNWLTLLPVVYFLVVAIGVTRLLIALLTFYRQLHKPKLAHIGKVKIIKTTATLSNSSFFNVIFINDDALEAEDIKQVISHEIIHFKLMHSIDRLISRIVHIILWFNPIAYFYIRSIEENHEFEVDHIITNQQDKGLYADLLLKLAVSSQGHIYHSFSKAPLKKRIRMLFNQPTNNMKKIIYLLFVPILVLSCLAFAKLQTPPRASAVGDISYLGPHPLVLIDGKEYPDDILYTISGSCILGAGIWGEPVGKYKNNPKAKDGVVEISLLNKGEITYLTTIEKDNMEAEVNIPRDRFYSRIQLKHNDGSSYEKIVIKMPIYGDRISVPYDGNTLTRGSRNNGMSINVNTGDKVVFVFDGKVFGETEVGKVEQLVKNNSIGEYGCGPASTYKEKTKGDLTSYDIAFNFQLYKPKK